METESAAAAFAALGQPTRLALIQNLQSAGPDGLPAGEIAEALGVTDRTVRRDWEKARLLLAHALKI